MKLFWVSVTGFCVFLFITPLYVYADTVYTWTDERGIVHITDYPPPFNGRLLEYEEYEPGSGRQTGLDERHQQWEQDRRKRDAERTIGKLRKEARSAARKAEKMKKAAEEAGLQAEELLLKNGSKKKRKLYRREAEKLKRLSKQLKAKAVEAEKQAGKAEEKAIQAEAESLAAMPPDQNDKISEEIKQFADELEKRAIKTDIRE